MTTHRPCHIYACKETFEHCETIKLVENYKLSNGWLLLAAASLRINLSSVAICVFYRRGDRLYNLRRIAKQMEAPPPIMNENKLSTIN